MSGIYIPRLRVPEDGFITITVTSDGRVVGNSKKESGKFEYLDNEDIAKAVPVPDHGRLIDADALIDELPSNLGIRGLEYLNRNESAIVSWIYAAPTIITAIPADKEGEG